MSSVVVFACCGRERKRLRKSWFAQVVQPGRVHQFDRVASSTSRSKVSPEADTAWSFLETPRGGPPVSRTAAPHARQRIATGYQGQLCFSRPVGGGNAGQAPTLS